MTRPRTPNNPWGNALKLCRVLLRKRGLCGYWCVGGALCARPAGHGGCCGFR